MRFQKIIPVITINIALYACSCNNTNTDDANIGMPDTMAISTAAIKGQAIFEHKCAACHGSDGTAGISNAANLRLSKSDSDSITRTITNGKRAMPSFASQLTPEEIADIAHYVLMLRQ